LSESSLGKSEFKEGVKAALPISVGVVPFGVAYGVLAVISGLPSAPAIGMSSILFAGSAQFVSVPLIGSGVLPTVILLSVLLVNLRHLLYSASLARYFSRLSIPWKVLLSYLLTDEAYAVTIIHLKTEEQGQSPLFRFGHLYFLGAGFTFWAAWQISTLAGVLFGTLIPSGLPLEFAITLTFIALLVPSLKDSPTIAASIVSGVVSVAAMGLPYRLNIMVAVAISVAAGLLVGWMAHSRRQQA
jgi:4-azaleucine resistance transporter AzlC